MTQNRFVPALALLTTALASASFAQTPAPAFEAASIRQAESVQAFIEQLQSGTSAPLGMMLDGSRMTMTFQSLSEIVRIAFHVKDFQVKGPEWMLADRFDIQAKLPQGATLDQVPQMLQALLVERFKMTTHREKRDLPVYALTVGKGPLKLIPASTEPEKPLPDSSNSMTVGTEDGPMKVVQDGKGGSSIQGGPYAGTLNQSVSATGAHLELTKTTMARFVDLLSALMDRPVVNMTGLTGSYTISLDVSMEDLRPLINKQAAALGLPLPPSSDASTPGNAVFAAMEKLGLKLDARKAPVDTIVVDHIEKMPTDN